MRIGYDAKYDILRIVLAPAAVAESEEILPEVVVDYDGRRRLVAIEILAASRVADFSKVSVDLPAAAERGG